MTFIIIIPIPHPTNGNTLERRFVTVHKLISEHDKNNTYLFHVFLQVKYLGEEGENTPIAGAVSICSPWDLLVSCSIDTHQENLNAYDVGSFIKLCLKNFSSLLHCSKC
jgi:predicted alpha/beta-fold hydrolase